jgi:hypothetical protein
MRIRAGKGCCGTFRQLREAPSRLFSIANSGVMSSGVIAKALRIIRFFCRSYFSTSSVVHEPLQLFQQWPTRWILIRRVPRTLEASRRS